MEFHPRRESKEAISRYKMTSPFCNACFNTFTYDHHLPTQVKLVDIKVQANRGCEQCFVIQGAVMQLFPCHMSNKETASQVLIDIYRPATMKVVWPNLANLEGNDKETTVRTDNEYSSTWLNFYSLPGMDILIYMSFI